jgi:uncharacterized glyoxalase superfamily protein PhnB
MRTKPIPEGFHAITPYLFAQGASRLIEFISAAFEGELISHQTRPDGAVMHATMRIRDSMLMLADPTQEFGLMPSSIYLYVTDCDTVYQRALNSGGISVFPMMTLPSGERYGGVKDPCGNIWWVATHVEDIPFDEQERRWREFKMPRLNANADRLNQSSQPLGVAMRTFDFMKQLRVVATFALATSCSTPCR